MSEQKPITFSNYNRGDFNQKFDTLWKQGVSEADIQKAFIKEGYVEGVAQALVTGRATTMRWEHPRIVSDFYYVAGELAKQGQNQATITERLLEKRLSQESAEMVAASVLRQYWQYRRGRGVQTLIYGMLVVIVIGIGASLLASAIGQFFGTAYIGIGALIFGPLYALWGLGQIVWATLKLASVKAVAAKTNPPAAPK